MPDENLPIRDTEEGQAEVPSADVPTENWTRDLVRFLAMVCFLALGCGMTATVILLVLG